MKRYEHFELLGFKGQVVNFRTTDSRMAETIITEVERIVEGKIQVNSKDYRYEFKKLRNRDAVVFDWLISWLCSNGWEPYAVWGDVVGGTKMLITTPHYCFRKEIE